MTINVGKQEMPLYKIRQKRQIKAREMLLDLNSYVQLKTTSRWTMYGPG